MQEADIVRLKHMLDAVKEITFLLKIKVLMILEKIENYDKSKEIPWKYITGMRNRLIHGYFDIDLRIVYTTANEDIPPLIDEIEGILG